MSEKEFLKAVEYLHAKKYEQAYTIFNDIYLSNSDLKAAAANFLAWMYQQGIYVEKDENKSFDIWMKGAMLGNCHSQMAVGECYEQGIGVEKDNLKSYCWYRVAKNSDVHNELGEVVDKLLLSSSSRLQKKEQDQSNVLTREILESISRN